MESLFTHLGINWGVLLAQGVNFFLLVVILNYFLYKPLVGLMNDRRRKIEKGLTDAELAYEKLRQAEAMKREEILKGEKAAVAIMEEAGKEGELGRKKILEKAEREAEIVKAKTEDMRKRLIVREMENLEKNAKEIIRQAIAVSANLHPDGIDGKLIGDAVEKLKSLNI